MRVFAAHLFIIAMDGWLEELPCQSIVSHATQPPKDCRPPADASSHRALIRKQRAEPSAQIVFLRRVRAPFGTATSIPAIESALRVSLRDYACTARNIAHQRGQLPPKSSNLPRNLEELCSGLAELRRVKSNCLPRR
jgi:hypothetical protein